MKNIFYLLLWSLLLGAYLGKPTQVVKTRAPISKEHKDCKNYEFARYYYLLSYAYQKSEPEESVESLKKAQQFLEPCQNSTLKTRTQELESKLLK